MCLSCCAMLSTHFICCMQHVEHLGHFAVVFIHFFSPIFHPPWVPKCSILKVFARSTWAKNIGPWFTNTNFIMLSGPASVLEIKHFDIFSTLRVLHAPCAHRAKFQHMCFHGHCFPPASKFTGAKLKIPVQGRNKHQVSSIGLWQPSTSIWDTRHSGLRCAFSPGKICRNIKKVPHRATTPSLCDRR